jgi:hypothetical protein
MRAGSGWQYVLADLSLILFMVTAAALAQAQDSRGPGRAAPARTPGQPLSPQAEPLAVYRAGPDAPPLALWLRQQSADPRQQLTIVARYRPGEQARALRAAETLARDAGKAGLTARLVVEPGTGDTTAALAFDTPGATARF